MNDVTDKKSVDADTANENNSKQNDKPAADIEIREPTSKENPPSLLKEVTFATQWQHFFSLSYDQAHPDMVDNTIRSNVRVAGTNLWVLMFAILIASIGLNVNSTAVIIGAMLISPLMSPIVGMGYGAAVGDVKLIRLAFRNMLIFIAISIFASTLYFAITPLEQAQSELLARTTPTLWDVLIAFFGGSAGIIALTRKEPSNTIPGVAIATALMPPLCTAGYGLAHQNWEYFFGASYLFTINCVFIAFATLLFSRLLKLPRRGLVTESTRKKQHWAILFIIAVVMIPSGFLATKLVQKELFNTTVNNAITAIAEDEEFYVLSSNMDYQSQTVGLIINGSGDDESISRKLASTLTAMGVKQPKVTVLYAGGNEAVDVANLKKELEQLKKTDATTTTRRSHHDERTMLNQAIIKEALVQYPHIEQINIARGTHWSVNADADDRDAPFLHTTIITIEGGALSDTDKTRLSAWLKQRLSDEWVQVIINGVQMRQ